ncbi:hypothetical protein DRO33_04300 [Candidatus Bathyarchaeota archaeon]|nr:MAG: hypothetical protein DRO33_04300 [Candidatus Bathyarchaeota archaeon]
MVAMGTDIFALLVREEKRKKLVRGYELLSFERVPLVPCMGVVAKLDAPIGHVLPQLFIMNLGRAAYLPNEGVLTLRSKGRLITLYPDGKVVVGRAWTEEAAREALDEVVEMVNRAYAELVRWGPPSEEDVKKAMELGWRDLLALLPGINCGKCGRPTCQALAVDVLGGRARLSDCPFLAEEPRRAREVRHALGDRIARALGL